MNYHIVTLLSILLCVFACWEVQAISTFPIGSLKLYLSNRSNKLNPKKQNIIAAKPPSFLTFFSLDDQNEGISYAAKKNFHVLSNGLVNLVKNFQEYIKLKKLERSGGRISLTYSQFKMLKLHGEDLSKAFRLIVTIPFSPEYFFYSYLVQPLMSYNNPWAWKSFPSTFDVPSDLKVREDTLLQRKFQAILSGLFCLQQETNVDQPKHIVQQRKSQLLLINDSLKHAMKSTDPFDYKDFSDAVRILLPFYQVPGGKITVVSASDLKRNSSSVFPSVNKKSFFQKDKKIDLKLVGLPWGALKECARAIGTAAFPNIPIVRSFNLGGIKGYFQSVRESDEFILAKGCNFLSFDEVKTACVERGIGISAKSEKCLRQEINNWLRMISNPKDEEIYIDADTVRLVPINEQNKRFAMMALNIAKDFVRSDSSMCYRTLFSSIQKNK